VDAVWAPTGIFPGPFNHPHAVRVDAYGRVYVADTDNNRVERLKPNGEDSKVWYIPVIPPKPGIHNFPDPFCNQVYQCGQWTGMAIDRRGQIYVTDTQHNLVFKLSPLGVVRDKFGGSGSQPGRFHNPEGIAVSSSGTIYVADTGNRRVQMFSPSGKLIGTIQQGLDAPADVLIAKRHGAASTLYVADSGSGRVLQFSVAS
jgi:DNA-binding beta-propeller fold protein YncE